MFQPFKWLLFRSTLLNLPLSFLSTVIPLHPIEGVNKGPFKNDVTQRGEKAKCDTRAQGLGHKSVTEGGRGLKIVQIFVTSFMNSP